MHTVTLGWNTADNITGAIRELAEKSPNNAPLKALYDHLKSGTSEPITIAFNDDLED